MKSLYWRIYSDYLMKNRFGLYRAILETALKKGYEHLSLIQFYDLIKKNGLSPGRKTFVLRHDIDSDVNAATLFFDIEKSLGVKSSYYFRLSTLDINLMKQIHQYGSEASYHYEELATYCKQNKIKHNDEVSAHLNFIKEKFKQNFLRIENQLGYK